ncbi:MAG: response regulator [Chloroflexi bacterium]|nr:response regulator [Chloroflexota bacterium]MBK6712291.1 response regulator [Chloroflexota bacterium]MBK7917047.1 response regulator [Chloroflexota bacterium]MBP6805399.1 response regulator [Chloroflexota bacterium]MBP7591919.1 response regulator [Chloroflexota bacterium]
MAQKILVIEDDVQMLAWTQGLLEDEGYDVLVAIDDGAGLKTAVSEKPDLILLDIFLPGMDGEEVARYLRADPETAEIPLIMLANDSQLDSLTIGHESPVDDYLIKPFDAVTLVTKILPYLGRKGPQKSVISSGNGELDSKMGGGIPLGSLTLVEGSSGAGKSVLSQQMIFGSLNDSFTLSLFTSENSVRSLVKQMRSLDLDILDYLLLGKIRVYPMELSRLGNTAPRLLLQAMSQETSRDMIIVDSLTLAIGQSTLEEVLGFFEECKRLCARGSSIILILHSHALNSELLVRIRSLCDAHLQLRTEEVGKKLVKTLEVTKVRGADKTTGNIVSFEVEPGWGMRVIPVSKVKG